MPKISLHWICRSHLSFTQNLQRGFTLIEILIAVAIFVSSLVFILPQVKRSENKVKKNLRDLQALNRTLYSYSRIHNRVYRLVLKINEESSSYWVEVKKTLDEKQEEDQFSKEEDASDNTSILNSKEIPHPFFEKDQGILKEPRTLPQEMNFEFSDENLQKEDENVLYITYDPHSFSPPVTILIKRKDYAWSLFFNPLLGELEISTYESS